MKIKINDEEITKELERIRKSVGGRKRDDFDPHPPAKRIEISIGGDKIRSLFHPSGLLILNDRPVFVYIRDHTTISFPPDPRKRNKIHFVFCQKLQEMDKKGRFSSRYHVTDRTDDKYYVDVRGNEVREECLYPCRFCLEMTAYHDFDLNLPMHDKEHIEDQFTAKEVMDLLGKYFNIFRNRVSGLKPDTMRAGYSDDWNKISITFRLSKKYICNRCRVTTNHSLTDSHHKDGDKTNNHFDNLECLCKICHSEEHPHYPISSEIRLRIEEKRRQQGVY